MYVIIYTSLELQVLSRRFLFLRIDLKHFSCILDSHFHKNPLVARLIYNYFVITKILTDEYVFISKEEIKEGERFLV